MERMDSAVETLTSSNNAKILKKAHNVTAATGAQLVSTGLSFGMKPWVEASMDVALRQCGAGKVKCGAVPLSTLLSNAAGGAYAGVVHNAIGASFAAYALHKLGGETFVDTSTTPTKRELNDFLTASLPVMGAFTASYAVGKALAANLPADLAPSPWVQAGCRMGMTMAGGLVQGALTAALKSCMEDTYTAQTKEIDASDLVSKFKSAVADQYNPQEAATFYKNGVGKLVGGTVGMVAASYAGAATLNAMADKAAGPTALQQGPQALAGAVGMMAFLGCWFGAAHIGHLYGQSQTATDTPAKPSTANPEPASSPRSVDSPPNELERTQSEPSVFERHSSVFDID
ncbi:MAG: hypothetical protein GJ677_15475 [Rhodobacteraceae bacterium]|nr:hypothetical protein [Paracoccaceae bacterium]